MSGFFGTIPERFHQRAWAAMLAGDLHYRVTGQHGRPANGGSAEPLVMGQWSPEREPRLCESGWHVTSAPHRWRGCRVFVVIGRGCGGRQSDKSVYRQVMPVGEVDPARCIDVRAFARCGDLSGADLSWADLREANLRGADLSGANLGEVDLREADLRGADLSGADLSGATLRWADLRGADLSWADLSGATLRWADLRGADLREADLRGADLRGANLGEVDLREADLREANLSGHDVSGLKARGAYYV